MTTTAVFGCTVAVLAWGAAGIFDKLAMKGIDPFSGVMVRMFIVTTAVVVFCIATGRMRPVLEFAPHTYLYLVCSGLMGGFIGQLAYYVAVKEAPVSQVVPITATYPVVAFLLAAIFLRESVTFPKVAGLVLVVTGLMLLSGSKAAPADAEAPPAAVEDIAPERASPARGPD